MHIGAFNLLVENIENDERSDAEATLAFFRELKSVAKEFEEKDGVARLFLLEVVEAPYLPDHWKDTYRNATFDQAVVAFTFGGLHWEKYV